MDISVRRQEPDTQQPSGIFASLQIFNRILLWLTFLIQLTEKEQEDAGIYLGDPYSREYLFSETIEKDSSHSDDKEKT
jgi:hypothetical protein